MLFYLQTLANMCVFFTSVYFPFFFRPGGSSEKRFKCDECELTYLQNKNLLAHKRAKHTGEVQKFKCSLCQFEYVTPYLLQKHLRSAHQINKSIVELTQGGESTAPEEEDQSQIGTYQSAMNT